MIRFATAADTPAVRALWETCFPDDSGFNPYFFEHRYDPAQTMLLLEGSSLSAMIQMLPYEMRLAEHTVTVTYIYGACTAPEARRRGLMAQLLSASFEWDQIHGRAASVLIPQEPWLFDFYAKYGYQSCFYVSETIHTRKKACAELSVRVCGKQDMAAVQSLYEQQMAGVFPHILKSQAQWMEQLDLFSTLGGALYGAFDTNGLRAYAFVWNDAQSPWAQEVVSLSDSALRTLLSETCRMLECDTLRIMTQGADRALGVAKFYDPTVFSIGYMNLMWN